MDSAHIAKDIIQKDILGILRFDTMSAEEKDSFLKEAADHILLQTFNRIQSLLPLDRKEEFERMLDDESGDKEEHAKFLSACGIDYQKILIEEIMRLKAQAYLLATQNE